jgi:hypothetical protein
VEARIDERDIERYLGFRRRVDKRAPARAGNLSRWSGCAIQATSTNAAGADQQHDRAAEGGKPVADWELAEFCPTQDWRDSYRTSVSSWPPTCLPCALTTLSISPPA